MLGNCIGFLTALAFIGVGASVVRVAKPMSGYLMIAAGLLELISLCCLGFVTSDYLYELDLGSDATSMTYGFSMMAGSLVHLIIAVLLAVSMVGVAKAAKAAAPPPS